jgi:hypothetical protein
MARRRLVSARPEWEKPRKIKTAGSIADPYFEWTLATKFAYYGRPAWLPILVELNVTVGEFRTSKVVRVLRSRNLFRLSPFVAGENAIPDSAHFCPAFVQEGFVSSLTSETALGGMIKRFELSRGTGPFPRGGRE